ncbi:transcription factor/nuclear export subunit protein 2 domain-containing protein [Phthorimaea operculella]|nr:transcription factor/nuclear export subunit protein 2 domain-containing protein [Phthorimaea operculella]
MILCRVLATAMRWHKDKNAFHKECAHYPGFVTQYRVSNQFTEANDHVGYENYRHVCHKWHYKITKAMVVCLDSGDYVQTRNALIVLIRVLPHFPVLEKLAQIIERKVEKVKDEEKTQRQDLFVLATGYSGQLRNKQPHMMRETDFHQVVNLQSAEKHKTATVKEVKEEPPAPRMEHDAGGDSGHSQDAEKRESRNSDRRRDDSDREKEIKRESRAAVKERVKEEVRSKDRSPRERSHRVAEERYLESVSPPHEHRHSQDDIERDVKRRKVETSGNGKGSKEIEERSPEKEKRKAKLRGDERKERKMSRKRDRTEETAILEKRRREEQKVILKMAGHQNGSQEEHHYEKYHKREKSPFRDRSHEEAREKHRRSNESKVRR